MAYALAPQRVQSQASPGMFVTHVDSEPAPSGTKSGGLEWHPRDSDAGGW